MTTGVMVEETMGDDDSIPCPSCGKDICLIDARIDGCLKPGYRSDCEHCGAEFVLTDVDYTATVFAKKAEPLTEGPR